ncbi:head decoration protein [Anatilimnocola floriformis]|uniref:head decoration protein n=1 Tax=Anatilimnocola floriformis TaxID=2948575 RepID=UPI0020C32045|nr:head decoration protein [Anatilimnocola floriformis]
MTQFTTGNAPGVGSAVTSEQKQITWSGRHGQDQVVTQRAVIHSSTTDSGNTPTTTLRAGLVVAIRDTDSKVTKYTPDANDGSQIAVGVLDQHQDMLVDGVATERYTQMIVHGLVREGELINLDTRARQQLSQQVVFDRKPLSPAPMLAPRGVYRKTTSYSLTQGDNGLLFAATGAATFTLPTKANGLAFRIVQLADSDLTIAGSGDLIHKGNAAASSVVFSTTGQKIGSQVLVECIYTASSTLKWLVTNLGGTTATVS